MHPRLVGALALVGAIAWLAKVMVIWANGGRYATEGVAGALMLVGAAAILTSAMARAWYLPRTPQIGWRVLAMTGTLFALVIAVDLPIPLARAAIGETWHADEVGIVLVAVVALVAGARWIGRGKAEWGPPVPLPRLGEDGPGPGRN